MALITKTGTYRGVVTDNGFKGSSGGYPQLVLNLSVTEYYDSQEQAWVDWSEQNEEIMAYLILFGQDVKKALFHTKAIKEVFNWSGQGFQELNNPEYIGTQLQFRVEENEYNDNITYQVAQIAKYDAVPGRVVQKADDATIKKLEAKYAQGLKALGGTKVASAPEPTGRPTLPKVTETLPTEAVKSAPSELPEMPGGGKCSKVEAWRDVVAKKLELTPDLTDDELAVVWTNAIQKIAPNAKKGNLTQAQWYRVRKEACEIIEIGF